MAEARPGPQRRRHPATKASWSLGSTRRPASSRSAPEADTSPRYPTTKLAQIPALALEPIRMPVEHLKPTFVDLCRTLAEGGGGEATAKIRRSRKTVSSTRAVLTLALRRAGRQRAWPPRVGTRSRAALARRRHVCGVPTPTRKLLESVFDRAPATADRNRTSGRADTAHSAGQPTPVERVDGARRFRCSLCAAAWKGRTVSVCTAASRARVLGNHAEPGSASRAPTPAARAGYGRRW